jgi:hypothetical protein
MVVGKIPFHSDPFTNGVIPEERLEKLGWYGSEAINTKMVPDRLWQTLVASRLGNNDATDRMACQSVMDALSRDYDYIEQALRKHCSNPLEKAYLEHMQITTCNRSLRAARPSLATILWG